MGTVLFCTQEPGEKVPQLTETLKGGKIAILWRAHVRGRKARKSMGSEHRYRSQTTQKFRQLNCQARICIH